MTPCAVNWVSFVVYGGVGLGHTAILAVAVYLAVEEHREGNEYGFAQMWWVLAFAELLLAVAYIGLAIEVRTGQNALCNRKLNADVLVEGPANVRRIAIHPFIFYPPQPNWNPKVDNPSRSARVQNHEHNDEGGFLLLVFREQLKDRFLFIGDQHYMFSRSNQRSRAFIAGNIQEGDPPCFSPGINRNRFTGLPFVNIPARILDRMFTHIQKKEVKRFLTVTNDARKHLPSELQTIRVHEQIRAFGKLSFLPIEVSLSFQHRKLFSGQVKALFHQAALPHGNARQYERRNGYKDIGYCAPVHINTIATQKKGLEVKG